MKGNASNNFTFTEDLTAIERVGATTTTTGLDHGLAPSVTYFISCGAHTGTALTATLQHSDNNSDWTAEADTTAGNTVSLALTDVGSGTIKVPNPRARYSRLSIVADNTCTFSVVSALGPLRSVSV